MGVGRHANVVHLIDFGLSKEYRRPNTHRHIPFGEGLGFIGTAAFAPINSHLGLELGRRDDMESLAYILLYFLWGFLPWQGLELEGQDILESKQGITTLDLFHELPLEFRMFYEHCRSLSFNGKPKYDHFDCLFHDLLVKEGFQNDMLFD
jgi:serine/threonine protein kinase